MERVLKHDPQEENDDEDGGSQTGSETDQHHGYDLSRIEKVIVSTTALNGADFSCDFLGCCSDVVDRCSCLNSFCSVHLPTSMHNCSEAKQNNSSHQEENDGEDVGSQTGSGTEQHSASHGYDDTPASKVNSNKAFEGADFSCDFLGCCSDVVDRCSCLNSFCSVHLPASMHNCSEAKQYNSSHREENDGEDVGSQTGSGTEQHSASHEDDKDDEKDHLIPQADSVMTAEDIVKVLDEADNNPRERKRCMLALESIVRGDIMNSPAKIPVDILAQERTTSTRLHKNLYLKSDVEIDQMEVAGRIWPLIAVHYTDPGNDAVPLLNMLNYKPPKRNNGPSRNKCYYSSFDWIPTPEMETFQVKDPNCYYQYDSFAAVSFKCDTIGIDANPTEDKLSVQLTNKNTPRFFIAMCQLNSSTHGTRFILLRILMTLCKDNRTDAMVYDTKLKRVIIWEDIGLLKHFW